MKKKVSNPRHCAMVFQHRHAAVTKRFDTYLHVYLQINLSISVE